MVTAAAVDTNLNRLQLDTFVILGLATFAKVQEGHVNHSCFVEQQFSDRRDASQCAHLHRAIYV